MFGRLTMTTPPSCSSCRRPRASSPSAGAIGATYPFGGGAAVRPLSADLAGRDALVARGRRLDGTDGQRTRLFRDFHLRAQSIRSAGAGRPLHAAGLAGAVGAARSSTSR